MAVVARFNAISEGLATGPEHYAPIFERTDDGAILAGPWSMGFLAAMQLRYATWAALRDLTPIEHGALLLPILLHCTDQAGRPLLSPIRPAPKAEALLSNAYHAVPIVVPAIREFRMPQRAQE